MIFESKAAFDTFTLRAKGGEGLHQFVVGFLFKLTKDMEKRPQIKSHRLGIGFYEEIDEIIP